MNIYTKQIKQDQNRDNVKKDEGTFISLQFITLFSNTFNPTLPGLFSAVANLGGG